MAFFGSGLYISGVSCRHLLNVSTEHIYFVKLSPTVLEGSLSKTLNPASKDWINAACLPSLCNSTVV